MSKRTLTLAVTGFAFSVAACGSYGVSVVAVTKTPARVASVSLTVPLSLITGQTARAVAIPKDANGASLPGRVISWFTSSASIASVTDSGLVSAVAPGSAVVSAVSEGISGQATMAVMPPTPTPIATLTVAVSPSSVLIGQTAHATATLMDSSGTPILGRVIAWQSSNSNVAAVAATGDITGLATGTAMISASSGGKSASSGLSVSALPPIPVASVSVSPATATVQAGSTVQLTAVTRDANNNVLTGRVIAWSSSNTGVSTVSASGLVTGIAAGSATITALSETKTGTAAITVSAPAPVPVASVSVSPATASLQVGATAQFSAVTRDANNNVLTGRVISWSSSNGAVATVSASGLATTVAAGTAQINATSEGQIGSATLTVASPPPPGGSPLWRGNEPAGMTFLNERPFSAFAEGAWETQGLGAPGASIVQDITAPHSPPNVLSANYPVGFIGGGSVLNTSTLVTASRVIYVCYWVKHSANWQGHITGVNKHGYIEMNSGNNPYFVYEADGVGSAPLTMRMALQAVVVNPNSDGWYGQNLVPGATLTRGQWDYIEILLTGNTAGTTDGALDVYLNGVHVSHWTGIQYSPGTAAWNYVRVYPVWGGLGDTVTAAMSLTFDHYYVSGKN